MDDIQLILVDPNPSLCHEWEAAFADLPNVTVVNGRFEELPEFDCMVSAANSFGLMDGGVDGAITEFFGASLMRRVQKLIIEEFLGEQPVGTSLIVETGNPSHPYLAHTPTMRVPMPISRTDYVYLATGAMLREVRRHNLQSDSASAIKTVACPGMGTGTGRMPFSQAARQMALAYRHYLTPPKTLNWRFADDRQNAINRGGDLGLPLRTETPPTEK